ncbi:MAG: Ig-like domain-containing protein [Bacteroidales bacterium]|nr:Ig-like domain-containing protein [Bacteroidales bacterium]
MKKRTTQDNSQIAQTSNTNPTVKGSLLKSLLFLCLMLTSVGAWAADYVLTYTANNGTTYYLARNGRTDVTRVNTFNPTTCIWSCENAAGAAGTIGNNTTYGWLYQTVGGTKYYLKHGGTVGLTTTKATGTGNNSRNTTCWRTNGTYVYNYYRTNTTTTYFITLNGDPGSRTSANANCAIPYQVTTTSPAANNDGITVSISCSGLIGADGIQLSRSVGGSYIPAHTAYQIATNPASSFYTYNGTTYTNTDNFKVNVSESNVTNYVWSVTAGTASVSNTGVVTLGNNNTQTVTVRCRTTINSVNKDATYNLNATATAALNETAYSDITITPSSQTLDLGEAVTYTVPASISQLTKTRPQYVTVTDAQGHTHYKVGTTYQDAEPTITETPGAAINLTRVNWAFSGGDGNYYTPSTYNSTSPNLTLTRRDAKTASAKTYTITATGTYGGQNKTASATVTIPATPVDLTALHAGEALNLGIGETGTLEGHYTWEPDYDAAGAAYKKFTYTSASTSVATVDASGKVTAVGPGQTTITLQSIKIDGSTNTGVSCGITVNVPIDAPTISIADNGTVTITHPVQGVQIHYTTNGTNPDATSGTLVRNNTASFGPIANETTVKAVAVMNSVASAVASKFYAKSSVSDGKVILNDYEDHTWTYYAGVPAEVDGGNYNTRYLGKLYSPNPRNVKITYNGVNGIANSNITVKVSTRTGEGQTSFVYYKTLEEGTTAGQYPYQVISNPFSVRPSTGTGTSKVFYGFNGWKIVSGGKYINGYNNGQTLPLDAEITFVNLPYPSVNCTSAEIVFETTWTQATVQRGGANVSNAAFNGGNYEKNFCVINANYTNALAPTYPVTITSVEPDGSQTYNVTFSNLVTPVAGADNTTKLEYITWNPSGNIDARGRNFTIGRGVTTSTSRELYGTNQTAGATNIIDQVLKVESGTYSYFRHFTSSGTNRIRKQIVVFGCDYDRAKADNAKLRITGRMIGAEGSGAGDANGNHDANLFMSKTYMKSGTFMSNVTLAGAGYQNSYYLGINAATGATGKRLFEMEGGDLQNSIAGGMDVDMTGTKDKEDYINVYIRIRGGHVKGCIYGAARYALSQGSRQIVLTGGEVNSWIAGGANGDKEDEGATSGASYIYVGGNAIVGGEGSSTSIGASIGGCVYGAGCGYGPNSTSGNMVLGTNVVVADEAYIERGVYGGGAFGYCATDKTANIYITGGHVEGKSGNYTDRAGTTTSGIIGGVFGGARMRYGGSANIYMTGGWVETGVFGGSNYTGTMMGNVKMVITGGKVGTDATHTGNVHGGGYGQETRVSGNVDLSIGLRDNNGVTSGNAVIYGDVYGGSALGYVNGTAATDTYHTNVTLNAGTINGSLYGGGLGNAGNAANVYGPVQVKVYGGSVNTTSAAGSGAVYGANNINGAPQSSVTVDIYGTDPAPSADAYALDAVYGGGNQANYTYGNGYPKVTVHNCDNSIGYVYGGGNAAAVAATDVTIYGGNKIGNVFGGGNGQVRAANVNGNTNVKIYGGTIGDVYGGSNTNGTIGGTINVNVNSQAEPSKEACSMIIDNVYSGGNKAPSYVGNLTIGCTGTDGHISNIYGGANQANVTGNINLLIKGGHIGNVFGGNNNSGSVIGTITVTVDWDGSCGTNYLENVYGGGNLAKYAAPQDKKDYPKVFIRNATIEENVFGGGKGDANDPNDRTKGQVTGNPQVKIGTSTTDESGNGHNIANHEITIKKSVYGGGNAAPVVGNTNVLIDGSALYKVININEYVFGGGLGETAAIKKVDASNGGDTHVKLVDKVNVSLNVYGGGNGGAVEGNTEVIIGEDN